MQVINLLILKVFPSSSLHLCFPSPFTICLQYLSCQKMFYRWKEAERAITGCSFTIGTPINRTFQQLMKGEKKKQISISKAGSRNMSRSTAVMNFMPKIAFSPLWIEK